MRAVVSILFIACLAATSAFARNWYVLPDGTGDAPTIQAGIDSALVGDTVEIACGQYPEHDIILKSGVIVRGESGSADCVILDLDQSGRGFYGYEVWHVVIEGITVQDGVTIYGAGIYSNYSQMIVRNCAFKRGDAEGDGAISALRSTMVFENCEFVANNSFNDGAGAIFSYESDVTITDCVFADNTGEGSSGGLWITRGQVDLVNCLFVANHALFDPEGSGGAIRYWSEPGSRLFISHCTFAANTVLQAIFCSGTGEVVLEHSIIAFNEGAALLTEGSSVPDLSCSDLFGNTGGDWIGPIADQLGESGNINLDPLFCSQIVRDFRLADDSPCLPAFNPDCGLIGAFPDGCTVSPAVNGPQSVASGCILYPNVPNPFNPQTTIAFALPQRETVTLGVFDMAGSLVRELVTAESHDSGRHEVVWNGRDDEGRQVASGTYLYRLEAGSYSETKRMVLVIALGQGDLAETRQ